MINPPGHLWRDKWTALSGPLSGLDAGISKVVVHSVPQGILAVRHSVYWRIADEISDLSAKYRRLDSKQRACVGGSSPERSGPPLLLINPYMKTFKFTVREFHTFPNAKHERQGWTRASRRWWCTRCPTTSWLSFSPLPGSSTLRSLTPHPSPLKPQLSTIDPQLLTDYQPSTLDP